MSKSYTMDELISGYFEKQFAEADEVLISSQTDYETNFQAVRT